MPPLSGNKSASGESDKTSVALVTDGGGVDDKSFQQSAWEGLKKWGKENGVKQGRVVTHTISQRRTLTSRRTTIKRQQPDSKIFMGLASN